jgi:hypothetical protein
VEHVDGHLKVISAADHVHRLDGGRTMNIVGSHLNERQQSQRTGLMTRSPPSVGGGAWTRQLLISGEVAVMWRHPIVPFAKSGSFCASDK